MSSVFGSGSAAWKRRNASSISAGFHWGNSPWAALASAFARFGAALTLAARPLAALATALRTVRVAALRVAFFAMFFGILTAMTADNVTDLEPTIFSAVITPHRSLGHVGFLVLMAAFGGISFIAGMMFLIAGAWPVFGFFGLDVLLLYWAFKVNYRHADAYEELRLTPSELRIRKVTHRGLVREWVLNPLWVKLEKITHEEFGIERLFLVSRGKQLIIASFLGPDEKESFAKALGNALAEARRGVTRTAV